jgi:hypothetical protein
MVQTAATAIDHRAEAARLADEAENTVRHVYGQSRDAQVYATLAQVHAQLAVTQPAGDDPYWAQAKELESLRGRYDALQRAESAAQVRLADLETAVVAALTEIPDVKQHTEAMIRLRMFVEG